MEKRKVSIGFMTFNFLLTILGFTVLANLLFAIFSLLANSFLQSVLSDCPTALAVVSSMIQVALLFIMLFLVGKVTIFLIFRKHYITKEDQSKLNQIIYIILIVFAFIITSYFILNYRGSIVDLRFSVATHVRPYLTLLEECQSAQNIIDFSMQHLQSPLLIQIIILAIGTIASHICMILLYTKWIEKNNVRPEQEIE